MFFFNYPATTEIYTYCHTLSLHDALPIFIHETGKKIAEAFEQAVNVSPAVVVIDEIDAFRAARDSSAGGQHRVEEVAEFLRSIPKAAENKVLVIGMTNRLDSLDPAVVRRGRFDHILEVGMPSEIEVNSLLTAKLADIPTDDDRSEEHTYELQSLMRNSYAVFRVK